MKKVVFNNLEESELLRESSIERLLHLEEKFPDLSGHRLLLTLSMENSPYNAGPDQFSAKIYIHGKKYKSLVMKKSTESMHRSLAELFDHLADTLNRRGDKQRVRARSRQRKAQKILQKVA